MTEKELCFMAVFAEAIAASTGAPGFDLATVAPAVGVATGVLTGFADAVATGGFTVTAGFAGTAFLPGLAVK